MRSAVVSGRLRSRASVRRAPGRGPCPGRRRLVNSTAGVRLISYGPGGLLPTERPRRSAMSPLVIIVFAPVVVGGLVLAALFLGAATAGVWEAVEERSQGRPTASELAHPQVAQQERANGRAA